MMREQGFLEGSQEHAQFPNAYEWMIEQMKKRLPNYHGESYPVWVWERRVNRNEKALLPKGQRGVILKLDIPKEDILWSSFDEWHCILNESPITHDECEWEQFEKEDFPMNEVVKTWDRLFNHDWLSGRPRDWAGDYFKDWMQGVAPRITMEQVQRVERFISK
jgi:hypothetical protein